MPINIEGQKSSEYLTSSLIITVGEMMNGAPLDGSPNLIAGRHLQQLGRKEGRKERRRRTWQEVAFQTQLLGPIHSISRLRS